MPVAVPRKTIELFSRAKDPKQAILSTVGDLSSVELMFNTVLVAIYIRPETTSGGIIRPDSNVAEDLWQSKAGLVLKLGPDAFVDDLVNHFNGQKVEVGDWCAFRIGDTWQLSLNNVACRLIEDTHIKMKLSDPSVVF